MAVGNPKKHRRVLVVDDQVDVAEMLSVLLTHNGFDVISEYSAPSALDAARKQQFDVIVTDIGMTLMSGHELALALRALPGYEKVPIIAVTGYTELGDQELGLWAAFDLRLIKPVNPDVLLRYVHDVDAAEHQVIVCHDLRPFVIP